MAILKATAQPMRSGFKLYLVFTALVVFQLKGMAQSYPAVPSKEYQVKSVFLFNFLRFVEWPTSASSHNTPLVIGVLGKNPFGSYLSETVKGEKINNRPVVVRYYSKTNEIKNCHVLFINLQKPGEIKEALADLKYHNILTVGDTYNFTQYGGIMQFFSINNKTKIRISIDNAASADLTISSKLLHLAEIVE